MATVSEALAVAVAHHQSGRLDAAEQIYRQILAADPNQADAWHLLGVIAHQVGRHDAAVELIGRSVGLRPTEPLFHNNLGNALNALARFAGATACYRRALELNPDYAEALCNLGAALKSQGKLDEAVACFRRAIERNGQIPEAHINLGATWRELGRPDEAADCFRRALELRPDLALVQNDLGMILREQGKLEEAVDCYRRALERQPGLALVHNNIGIALNDLGKTDEAVACYRRAVELAPEMAEPHNNLGVALQGQGRPDEAVACFRRALELRPGFALAHNNLGRAFQNQARLDEAVECYRRALEIDPSLPESHSNLGNTLKELGRPDEAVACFRRAIDLRPDFAEAHYNLGTAFSDQGKPDEAAACYVRALESKPDFAEAHFNLGTALRDLGRLDEAVASYRRALELRPDHAACRGFLVHTLQHLCEWNDLESLARSVVDGVSDGGGEPISPFVFLALPTATTAEQQLRCARDWADRRLRAAVEPATPVVPRKTEPPSKIVVGYLSADFHSHATALLIAELFERHDRGRFEVFGYSYGPDDGSPMRRRLVRAFDRFTDLKNASHRESARRIEADGVDVLVDLKGYTQDARTEILARRPAPVQVNYLGYPGTMGAAFVDYVLVDEFVVPPDQQEFFTERLVHVPGCYQVNDGRREIAARTPTRAECGLPEDGFVFCSFNNTYKITPEMFDAWMSILRAVPGSVLWLLEGNRFAPGRLRCEAEARGVSAERLVLAPRLPSPEHLARHRQADLFLDSFPYNAHTTASDALWAGLPVLTRTGRTFASRVAGSLLHTLGLDELITHSLDEYQAAAVRLARDAESLAELRSRLAANRETSPLFDAGGFARNIEKAFERMREIHAAGESPRGFAVTEDP
ncbi:MAG: tetratricopeptide repeat protein [Isosphaeraceae bacterium]